jgi:hypothetical protein
MGKLSTQVMHVTDRNLRARDKQREVAQAGVFGAADPVLAPGPAAVA